MLSLTYLKLLCEQIEDVEVVKAFNHPLDFINEKDSLDFDVVIMDIEMPEFNGLQVAEILKDKQIIFTTAYKDYAAEAFDLRATDYVRKPIKSERLQQAISKAKENLQPATETEKSFVQLNTNLGRALIFFDQLLYIKTSDVDSRDKIAYLTDGTQLILKNINFDRLEEVLPQHAFSRINKREIIALKAVKLFSTDEITTNITDANGDFIKLTLSEVFKKNFESKLNI